MRVKELMTSKVFTVEQQDLIDRDFFLVHYEKIRHLPVVKKGKVIDIVSDRDLYKALAPKNNSNVIEAGATEPHVAPKIVRNIMRRGVLPITLDTHASEVAAIMADNKVGALSVVKLVGILSSTDVLMNNAHATTH